MQDGKEFVRRGIGKTRADVLK